MHDELALLSTLTGGFTVALLLGLLARRLRLSPIVGYLLGGVAVGPFTPGFVAHPGLAAQLAEVGVILLMFGVGLHFHLDELMKARKIAIPGALAQIAAATGLGVLVARWAGWPLGAGVVFGLAISVASTVVLLRVLADQGALDTPAGHLAVAWLLVEDLCTILVLVLLPLLAGPDAHGGGARVVWALGVAIVKIAALVAFTLLGGRRLIPALLRHVARTGSGELFTLAVLVVALGLAVGAAELFGASLALGAFLAGTVVGQSEFSARAASEALPMRDAFAVLFFVSMGMLFDPAALGPNLALAAATLGVVLIGKPLAAFVVALGLGAGARVALTVACALAQIGEFSFILATAAIGLGILPERAMQVLVIASIVSIALNPLLFRLIEPAAKRLAWTDEPSRSGAASRRDRQG